MAPIPGYIPRAGATRKPAWARIAVMLLVVGAYVGVAALNDGPIQVWLLVLAPIALAAVATALRIIDPSEPD